MTASKRKARTRFSVNAENIPLVEYGITESKDGFILYVRSGARDVHLTVYQRNGVLNCHITDTSKPVLKVWEMEDRFEEIARKITKSLARAIRRYYWNETFYVPHPEIMSLFEDMAELGGPGKSSVDIMKWLSIVKIAHKGEEYFIRMRIREGLAKGIIFGFQCSKTQTYGVFPIDMKACIKFNVNPSRSYLQHSPIQMGIIEYSQYLDKENLIDWMSIAENPEFQEKFNRALGRIEWEP